MISGNDETIFKLLHYFITVKNYNPVILHGVKDEIWLENLEGDYKIIRLVSNYIHNNEQLQMDLYKTNRIVKSIKKKTLSFNVPILSIMLNTGENVHINEDKVGDVTFVVGKELKDITDNENIIFTFPDLKNHTNFKEKGIELFAKITNDINKKTEKDTIQAEDIFKPKKPVITYVLILINVLVFLISLLFDMREEVILYGGNHRELIRLGDYYRLITSMFIHVDLLHLLCNCYSLYVVGNQIESFFGKTKYLIIYFGSGIIASLLSICFNTSFSIGASGAIFGLLGSILYFGYHYRLYLGNVLKTQIIPLIILNLLIGFASTGIDNAAHIGGLIGGILVSMICGLKYKSNKVERFNGILMTIILLSVIIYLGIFGG